MNASTVEILATVCFSLAILHTFLSSRLHALGNRFPEGSISENFFHFVGEVEVVFGIWAAVFMLGYFLIDGKQSAVHYAEAQNFTEPLFVFAIMAMAATAPILYFANRIILFVANLIPSKSEWTVYFASLAAGPLLGSLITEPAAMTVTALLLKQRYYDRKPSEFFKYVTIAVLFVNISIGGVLTHFAAPPVLMVASKWDWGLLHMLQNFGWKATIAVIMNASLAAFVLRAELSKMKTPKVASFAAKPKWLIGFHLLFLAAVVYLAHYPVMFLGIFLFFMGFVSITSEFQTDLRLKESLLVAFFLAGLVVLGSMQKWWLDPVIRSLSDVEIFFSAAALTAITDNAALTYLGSQIDGLSESFKYYLVAGAIAGGGLTVIANAPNPAGFSILQSSFGDSGIKPLKLLLFALLPTLIALLFFFF
jgi:hypothetical protein